IYTLMGALAREGRALVVVSSDLRELMLICDRIGVMSAGRMTAVFERGNWTQDALLAAAFAGFGRDEAARHPAAGAAPRAASGASTTGPSQ
ncbi:sugar ABC transporter ATP-binding protein, partial [Burkholderia ubonensis]